MAKVGNSFFGIKARLLLTLFFLAGLFANAQVQDTVVHRDSLRVYKKIKRMAYKYKYTRMLYHYVFVDPEPGEYPRNPASKETKIVNPYLQYDKKIIRRINIDVYDPFGNSITDTCCRRLNFLQRAGNKAHITTREWVIINRLLFKENERVDPLALSETERIMREAVFVNDAKVFITKTSSSDSVDVNVIVVDKWPVTVPIIVTDISASARLRNNNLFGLGQQFEQYAFFRKPDELDFSGYYNITNIDNTFMSSRIAYQANINGTSVNLGFDRPFISPIVKWSWGANLYNSTRYFNYTDPVDSVPKRSDVDVCGYDVWSIRNIKLSKRKTLFNQSTNLVVGARHYKNFYPIRPSFLLDTGRVNSTTSAVIGNVGFAVQQYHKDRFIYRFGSNEDVPQGLIVQFIYGGLKPEFSKVRYYMGGEVARAKQFSWGYLTGTFSYGIFFNKKVPNDITTNYNLYYFSNLKKSGRWLFRQFINYNLVHGENKIMNERITLTSQELYGFQSQSLLGNTKMILNSETVAYAPYKIVGFRFAPVFQIGLGMIGDKELPVYRSRLYQGYTLGLMVRNENLLVSTFQFSVGMYPFFPDAGNYRFIYNPVTSFTLRVRTFGVSRPEFVSYY